MTDRVTFKDSELLYAATSRCRCGAGLAYPMDHEAAMILRAWVCSAVLRGDVEAVATRRIPFGPSASESLAEHVAFDWAFYKIREETSVNNAGGFSTRPAGTVARTIGKAKCPKCSHQWESEPYSAGMQGHHWQSGPCPKCGYAVGATGSWSSTEGEGIDRRYPDIVLPAP